MHVLPFLGQSTQAMAQNQWDPILGFGAPPMLVLFSGDWDVHWGYGLLTHGHLGTTVPPPPPLVEYNPTCRPADGPMRMFLRRRSSTSAAKLQSLKCEQHFPRNQLVLWRFSWCDQRKQMRCLIKPTNYPGLCLRKCGLEAKSDPPQNSPVGCRRFRGFGSS